MIRFNLDKDVGLNFYEQIKGQLLSAIYCGKIQEGERLPSIRELADDLKVNHKTIRKIYLRLVEEDYVEMIRGSGAFLKKRSGEDTYEQMRKRALFRLLTEVAEKSKSLGVSPEKFARLLESQATGTNLRKLRLIVVDHEEEAMIFSRELQMRLGAEVRQVSLNRLDETELAEPFHAADYLLTTSWHLEEVRRLAKKFEKPVLELKPRHEIYTEILSYARHRNVAIVIRDEHTLHASWEVFMNIFYPSTQKKFWISSIDRTELIDQIIQEAEVIFVSPMCWDEMRRRTPAEKELRTYENFISEETINRLKEIQLLG